jgi:hypothetical protein
MDAIRNNILTMDDPIKYALTEDQLREWEDFIINNSEEIYRNKDIHEVHHETNSPFYIVSIFKYEQSGMQEFLEELVAI